MSKKGFTLIEIILALIIASIASAYVIKTIVAQDFQEELVNFQDNLKVIIEEGIASPNGYVSGGGTPCSPNSVYDYTNLTTTNLHTCLNQGESWGGLLLTTTTPAYLTSSTSGFMNGYGGFGSGALANMACGIETVQNPFDARGFYVLVDCSRIAPLALSERTEADKRRLAQIEEAIEFLFVRRLDYMFVSSSRTAVLLSGTGSGTNDDGIVWGSFKH